MPESPVSALSSPHALRAGALGALTSAGAGVGAAAPAYGLTAVLGWEAAADGPRTLLAALLALVPVLASAWTQRELSRKDPDCGTSFAWAARAFGPRAGRLCGWSRIAADLLVMAVLVRIAGEYLFTVAGLPWIGQNAISPVAAAGGLAVLAGLAWLGRRGARAAARLQAAAGGFSVAVLLVLAAAVLVRALSGGAAAPFSWSWLDPAGFASPGAFMSGMTLMVFACWGWDTAFSLGEETAGPARGMTSALVLGAVSVVVVLAAQLAGGPGVLGAAASRLLAAAVLASAAGGLQGRLASSARTALSMAAAGALPPVFGRVHPRFRTPSAAIVAMAAAGAVLFAAGTCLAGGDVLADAVAAAGFFIALYLAAAGFAGFRDRRGPGGLIPLASGIMMTGIGVWSVWFYAEPDQSYSVWRLPLPPRWTVGGVLGVGVITALAGVAYTLIPDTRRRRTENRMLLTPHSPLHQRSSKENRNTFLLSGCSTYVKVRTPRRPLCHS
ncbi:MAG: amino acid permease [Streptosporangiales bacterium]|nr:amino acid permease [Streptosporangiales bacterium]